MLYRLEIRLKEELKDPEGISIKRKAKEYLGISLDDIRVIRVLTIDSSLSKLQIQKAKDLIFTNPVTEVSSFSPLAKDFDWIIWVGFRPGVRDTAGSTAIEAIEDLLKVKFKEGEGIYTSKIYEIRGEAKEEDMERIARELLANEIIQQWKIFKRSEWDPDRGIGFIVPKVILDHIPTVYTFNIESDKKLMEISKQRNLALHPADIPIIRRYFLREDIREERRKFGLDLPTDVELEYISQARSDHCNHNTFRGFFRYRDTYNNIEKTVDSLFRTCIEEPTREIMKEKDWVISVLWDNAGVARFDDDSYYTITGETHNSPSNMEPYGGALTGIVGVYRDPLGTGKGSKLILGMYGFCVGPRDYSGEYMPYLHPRRLLDGVIEGVRDGGNKSGVPTPFGHVVFDESYMGKCLVFVTAIGIMPSEIKGESTHKKTTEDGDLIVMCGGRVGKDGIHGVTAASETFSEHTPAGHVQIGDPYTQKKMHDFLLEARDEGLIAFITDNGGGGLSSSVGESARFSNGCEVDLDIVPLKYEGLDQWEIWVSESQERMTVAVKPGDIERFMELARKHEVECTVIGRYTNSGYLLLRYGGKPCALIRLELLKSEFPQWEFEAEWIPPQIRGLKEPEIPEPEDHGRLLKEILSRANICSKNWIARQYDHEVQGGSVIKPLIGKSRDIPSDAVVVRPILDRDRGIVVSQALNPFYSMIDTYHMTAITIDEAVRRVLAVGGDPDHLGGVDNFCWPTIQYDPEENPDGKYKAAQLVRSCWALRDYCLKYRIPLLSGKDSMYVDGILKTKDGRRKRVSALPTLMFTVTSVVKDIMKCITLDVKQEGDLVYILGMTRDELGASEYYLMHGKIGLNVPKVNPDEFLNTYYALHEAIDKEILSSAHSVGRGGLGVHLSLVAMAGELGMEICLSDVIRDADLTDEKILYSESAGRFIVTVSPHKREDFLSIMSGVPISYVGRVTSDNILKISEKDGRCIIEEDIFALKDAWLGPFRELV